MDGDRRQQVVDRFQTDPATRVLVTTMGALGVGVTLTAARYMIIAELPWTPGAVEQMIDRVHRIGQHGEVTAQVICADGTIDGFIANHIAEKGKHIRTLMQ